MDFHWRISAPTGSADGAEAEVAWSERDEAANVHLFVAWADVAGRCVGHHAPQRKIRSPKSTDRNPLTVSRPSPEPSSEKPVELPPAASSSERYWTSN
jgi:hypothetical protein